MPLFLDTSDLNQIQQAVKLGVIAGVTTNPKILAKAGVCQDNLKQVILSIVTLVKGPVSVELTEGTIQGMLEQAKVFGGWDREHIVIKVPMGLEELEVVKGLKDLGLKTNVTGIMSSSQAFLAAASGATYVSIFAGRIRDMGYDADPVIAETAKLILQEQFSSKIIVGSIRHMMDVVHALRAGAHIITVPPEILKKMAWNPNTDLTIAEFNREWESTKKFPLELEKIIKG